MQEQKTNKTSTNTEQMIHDLIRAAGEVGDTETIDYLTKVLNGSKFQQIANAADKTYNSREYKTLRFVQVPTLQENLTSSILHNLSLPESKLYIFLLHIANRGLFQISRRQAQIILGLSRDAVRKAFKGLLDKHILYVVEPETNKIPAIYRLNSQLCRAGKTRSTKEDLLDIESIKDWDIISQRMKTNGLVLVEATRMTSNNGKKQIYTTIQSE